MTPITKRHHPTLSPSSFPAKQKCPCYTSDPKPGGAAERGIYIHMLMEMRSQNTDGNWKFIKKQNTFQFEGSALEEAEWGFSKCQEILGKHGILPDQVEYESELTLIDDDFNEVTYGTIDVLAPGIVIDYKTGDQHDYKPQMAVYALMVMRSQMVDTVIVYELYTRSKEIVWYTIDRAGAEQIVFSIVNAIKNPDKKPNPCDYCGWCGSQLECPALNERAITVAKNREDWQLTNYHSSQIIDPTEMSKALLLARQLEGWVEAVKSKANEMAILGQVIPGFTLAERSGSRKIADIRAAFERLQMPIDNFLPACEVKITKLEECYLELFPNMKKSVVKKELESRLGELITTGQSTKFLTPIKEKR